MNFCSTLEVVAYKTFWVNYIKKSETRERIKKTFLSRSRKYMYAICTVDKKLSRFKFLSDILFQGGVGNNQIQPIGKQEL